MFTDFDPDQYELEARVRWGDTDAYRESARRTAAYREPEWAQIRAEAQQLSEDFAALMGAGEPATGAGARSVAERHREHLAKWFYPVPTQMHRNLAEMYVADSRFAANYEQVAGGLASYVRDAIVANADVTDRQ